MEQGNWVLVLEQLTLEQLFFEEKILNYADNGKINLYNNTMITYLY